jgi:uncharacterized protein YdaU (DUF1376 family)
LNIDKEFKNPHRSVATFFNIQEDKSNHLRLTDLCEYCEKEISMRKKLAESLKNEKYEFQEEYDIVKLKSDISQKAIDIKMNLDKKERINNELIEKYTSELNRYKVIISDLSDYEVRRYFTKTKIK